MTGREEFEKWKHEGFALLTKMEGELSERERALARLTLERDRLQGEADQMRSDIAEVRKSLPRSTPRSGDPAPARDVIQALANVTEAASRTVHVQSRAPVIDIVRAVLGAADHALTASEILRLVRAHRPTAEGPDVHRAIYRLKDEIAIRGERPTRLYSLREQGQTNILAAAG